MEGTSILHQNTDKTVFLIDIPTSIALAQELSLQVSKSKKNILLSTPAPENPFPESGPKSDKARERMLHRVRDSWSVLDGYVEESLRVLRDEYNNDEAWCLPRRFICKNDEGKQPYDYEEKKDDINEPPIILSPTTPNLFESMTEIGHVVVKNPARLHTTLTISDQNTVVNIPPLSRFVLCTLPLHHEKTPIPSFGRQEKFNLILFDPPWPNRSARRTKAYHTQSYTGVDILTDYMQRVLCTHLQRIAPRSSPPSIGAIWTTNSDKVRKAAHAALTRAGLHICEEWVWIKATVHGEPVTPVDGLWRKPYEVLVIGMMMHSSNYDTTTVTRRAIAAVPDLHSRKPNLRELFERVFFNNNLENYSALEVFARNLTAGWWACGDEVIRFNSGKWWTNANA